MQKSRNVCKTKTNVSQGLEKSVEMENLVLPLKDVSDQVRPFLNQFLRKGYTILFVAAEMLMLWRPEISRTQGR